MTENAEDLGEPVAYLVVREGVPVYAPSGATIGTLEHVLADENEDVFHGLLVTTPDGPRFAAGDRVAGLYERGVVLTEEADRLPRPKAALPGEHRESGLKRAWDWLVQPH